MIEPRPEYGFEWYWKAKLPERKGEACRILIRGGMNSVLVEFERDGYRVVTASYAVRPRKDHEQLTL